MINEKNYYEVNNKGLSQSKIKDFLLDKNYFYRKHITGELEKKTSKVFTVGSAIDNLLTGEESIEDYAVLTIPEGEKDTYWRTKIGREHKQDIIDSGKTIITQADYDQIIEVADAVEKTSAYRELKKDYRSQEILIVEDDDLGEHFKCLYGKPDFYKIIDNVCYLPDLKTTNEIDNTGYYYKAKKYGYFKQLWYYSYLLKNKHPDIKEFRYYHLAVEKAEPFRVKLYQIPNSYVNDEERAMLKAINDIIKEKEFKKDDASFDNPELLLDPRDK